LFTASRPIFGRRIFASPLSTEGDTETKRTKRDYAREQIVIHRGGRILPVDLSGEVPGDVGFGEALIRASLVPLPLLTPQGMHAEAAVGIGLWGAFAEKENGPRAKRRAVRE